MVKKLQAGIRKVAAHLHTHKRPSSSTFTNTCKELLSSDVQMLMRCRPRRTFYANSRGQTQQQFHGRKTHPHPMLHCRRRIRRRETSAAHARGPSGRSTFVVQRPPVPQYTTTTPRFTGCGGLARFAPQPRPSGRASTSVGASPALFASEMSQRYRPYQLSVYSLIGAPNAPAHQPSSTVTAEPSWPAFHRSDSRTAAPCTGTRSAALEVEKFAVTRPAADASAQPYFQHADSSRHRGRRCVDPPLVVRLRCYSWRCGAQAGAP
jgi:hypothetical protein